jgi:hypothetical protein
MAFSGKVLVAQRSSLIGVLWEIVVYGSGWVVQCIERENVIVHTTTKWLSFCVVG